MSRQEEERRQNQQNQEAEQAVDSRDVEAAVAPWPEPTPSQHAMPWPATMQIALPPASLGCNGRRNDLSKRQLQGPSLCIVLRIVLGR